MLYQMTYEPSSRRIESSRNGIRMCLVYSLFMERMNRPITVTLPYLPTARDPNQGILTFLVNSPQPRAHYLLVDHESRSCTRGIRSPSRNAALDTSRDFTLAPLHPPPEISVNTVTAAAKTDILIPPPLRSEPPNVGISCGRVRRPGGPARRVLRRRRDGSGRQLHAELGDSQPPLSWSTIASLVVTYAKPNARFNRLARCISSLIDPVPSAKKKTR
jgi:hypothetical protein